MSNLPRRSFLSAGVGLVTLRATSYPQWKMVGPWGGSARVVRLDPAKPTTLLAATMRGAGIFRSLDGGETWAECLRFPKLPEARVDAALIVRNPTPLWLAGTAPGGLWTSKNEGNDWELAPGTSGLSVYAIAAWEKDPRVLAIGTNQGVWLSHDGAQTWRRNSPANNADLAAIVSVAFHPKLAGTIYAGTPHLPWKTSDGGKTWRRVHVGMFDDSDIFSIAVDPAMPERVFASACSGIYCSLNGGAAWRRAQGIPGTNRRTYVVAQDPLERSRVFAGTSAGMWASQDVGQTWKKLNSHVATSIAFHPEQAGAFYVSTEQDGILFTADAGQSFQARHEGFVSRSILRVIEEGGKWRPARELEIEESSLAAPPNAFETVEDPFNPGHLLAATGEGLLRSKDGGRSWRLVDGGLGQEWVRSVCFHPKQPQAVLALRGQRVFWSKDAGASWYWLPAEENVRSSFRRLVVPRSNPGELLALSEDRGVFSYPLKTILV
ncbi:MAG: YCF48-related protein [Bryobacter sp.]|nr:YCF48-related protein [Bryobacter sp.]